MRVVDLKALAKERRLRGYSKLKKADLIAFLQDNLQPTSTRIRPPRPTRPPPPPPSVRFRPDRPRQPELLRQLNERSRQPELQPPDSLKPFQLRPKRGKKTFIEPPVEQPPSQKQIKRMKKKLGKLNKKIRHSEKKNNGLISKRNSLRKKIEELKEPGRPEPKPESFNPIERQQAFNRAYRNYRIDGRPRMDM